MAKPVPFPFVLEELFSEQITVKPMFGCHALYRGDKILLILRSQKDHEDDNGVWVATSAEHHESLRKQIPSLRSIKIFGPGESSWQNIPVDGDDFERDVLKTCELIRSNDPRIGRIPAKKKKKKAKT